MEACVIKRADLLSAEANSSVMENAGFQGYGYQGREVALLSYLEVQIYMDVIISGENAFARVRPDESCTFIGAGINSKQDYGRF